MPVGKYQSFSYTFVCKKLTVGIATQPLLYCVQSNSLQWLYMYIVVLLQPTIENCTEYRENK